MDGMQVFTKEEVPDYGPALPNPAIFDDAAELRHFILVKCLCMHYDGPA